MGVLVYHHIEDPITSDVSCTPESFLSQMSALVKEGFTPITLDQTRLFLTCGLPEIAKPVLITFDDGYESLFHHALPVARRLKIPMTVFVVTSRIGLKPQFTPYLTEAEIREMSDSGYFDFGSHSDDLHLNHLQIFKAFLTRPNPVLKLLGDDLATSKTRLERIIGKPVYTLAWPYGKYNDLTRDVARKSGFYLHFTSQSGYNEPGSNPFGIKRIPVTSRDTPASVLKKAGN